jgi:uncharacterized RDD family membrane protein YckC
MIQPVPVCHGCARELSGTIERADFGIRLVSYVIDSLLVVVVSIVVQLLLGPLVGGLIAFGVGAIYQIYFWSTTGATPGKMMLGLKVVSQETGDTIDMGTAILRYVGYFVSGIAVGLGFFWIAWDRDWQGWHDKMAKTQVIRVAK